MSMIKVFSPAKVNLDLLINYKRDDCYHDINSLVQTVNLYDELVIQKSENDENVTIDFPLKSVLYDKNLIVLAAKNFLEAFNIKDSIHIKVKKRIPLGSGLGGGSSNAAATLIGLSKIFEIDDFSRILNIARGLGSDIPFFLFSRTAKISGRGEVVTPFKITNKLEYLLIFPGIESKTNDLYNLWDKDQSKPLKDSATTKFNRISLNNEDYILKNDFTPILLRQNQIYSSIFETLDNVGIRSYSISGSGSTVFCLLEDNYDSSEAEAYIESSGALKVVRAEPVEGWHFSID